MRYVRRTELIPSPVTVAEVKQHLKIEADDKFEDGLIDLAIAAVLEHVDGRSGVLNRVLMKQTWEAYADAPVCSALWIDLGPVLAITRMERQVGGAWVEVPAADYALYRVSESRAYVAPIPGKVWPGPPADPVPGAWRVTYEAGYGSDPAAVPAAIRYAIMMMVADLFGFRGAKISGNLVDNPTVNRLLAPYRIMGM